MAKERIVVICPGRGSYTRNTSNYLKTKNVRAGKQIAWMDKQRKKLGLPTLTELDSKRFNSKVHMVGEHASPLIYACSLSDYYSINQDKYEIVAITGNSMGWYIALALSGALNSENAYHLINRMGSMMKEGIIGGQIIYPIVDENWQIDESKKEMVINEIKNNDAHISIYLGGYVVIGGAQKSLDALLINLPEEDNYPFQVPYHGAFHTPLMESISIKAMSELSISLFEKPTVPLVDGRGYIWSQYSTEPSTLFKYTLDYQVIRPYNFNHAVTVALKEFCPDKLVLLGPGNTIGGSIGQIMIQQNWLDLDSKESFIKQQKKEPYLISMGVEGQHEIVSK